MRVSTDIDDSGFIYDSSLVKVKLNGIEINDCVTADDLQRMVVRLKRDDLGEFMLNENKDGFETYTEYGEVFIDISRLTQENIDGNQT